MNKLFLLALMLTLAANANAELYKVVADDGSVTFTDIAPSVGAQEHKLGRINSVGNPNFNQMKLNMTIPYEQKNGSMVVQGSINGISMNFIVDTGATLLAIPPAIAKKAGLLDEQQTMVTAETANGAVDVPKVIIKTVVINNTTQKNVAATIQDISTTNANLGLLGMSFFKHYKMTVDQNKHEIQLTKK